MRLPGGLFHFIKSWQRVEARSRTAEPGQGLEARTADPLWFLTRQWVMGEFQGEDAGSLVATEMTYRTENITDYGNQHVPYRSITSQPPLEVLIEREKVAWNWRMRIRVGQQFERYIREHSEDAQALINTCRTEFPVKADGLLDEDSLRYVKLMEGRAIDGEMLWTQVERVVTGLRPAVGAAVFSDHEAAASAARSLYTWYNELYSQPPQGENKNLFWQSNTLNYNFSVRTNRGTELASSFYRNGDLEWYNANLKNLSAQSQSNVNQVTKPPPMPNRIRFAGMAHARWWAMDDNVVDFGKMDVSKSELIKTMLMEFALVHGDDWFVVPMRLPTGVANIDR